jgi:hypothetical protein
MIMVKNYGFNIDRENLNDLKEACKQQKEIGASYLMVKYNNSMNEYTFIAIYSEQDAAREVIKEINKNDKDEELVGVIALLENIEHQIYNMFRPLYLRMSRVVN